MIGNGKCSLCGFVQKIGAENCFGFRYLCKDCASFLFIRYNPGIFSFDEAQTRVNNILNNMKKQFKN